MIAPYPRVNEGNLVGHYVCAQIGLRFYHLLDEGRYEEIATMFSPDGIWTRQGETLLGQEAILTAMRARNPAIVTRHVVTNQCVDLVDGDAAVCEQTVLLYRSRRATAEDRAPTLEPPLAILAYRFDLSLVMARWWIARAQGREIMVHRAP